MKIRKPILAVILLLAIALGVLGGVWLGTQRGPDLQPVGAWLYNFQTLASGILAVLAALLAAAALWWTAKMPIDAQRRRERRERKETRAYLRESLMGEFRVMIDRARDAASHLTTYKNTLHQINDDNRERMTMQMPEATLSAQSMILLGPEVMARYTDLARMVEQHNAQLRRATGQIGTTGVSEKMRDRANAIADMAHQLANKTLFNLKV